MSQSNKFYAPMKGFTSVHQHTTSNDIQDNLIEYFDWALLEKGNYFNSALGEVSPDSEDYSRLRLSKNENFTAGQVWEGFRENWGKVVASESTDTTTLSLAATTKSPNIGSLCGRRILPL